MTFVVFPKTGSIKITLMKTWYFILRNGKLVRNFRTLAKCLDFIKSKGWKDDGHDHLAIIDEEGNMYNWETGARE